MKYLGYLLLTSILFSCNQKPKDVQRCLELAGENKAELQKVINHYLKTKENLKLEATYFLIENMDTKYSYNNEEIGPHKSLLSFVDSLHKAQDPVIINPSKFWTGDNVFTDGHTVVDSYWDTLKLKNGPLNSRSLTVLPDLQTVKANQLIENIDYAFKVWENPWAKHLNFDQFCEYVLPYRNLTEPITQWRKEVYEDYKSELKKVNYSENIALNAAQALYERVSVVKNNYFTFREYPDLGWEDLNKVRMGTCRDQSNFIIYVMRSQGIPIGTVFLPYGTEWEVLLDSKGNYLQFGAENFPPDEDSNYYLSEWKSPATSASKFFQHSFKKDMRLLKMLALEDIPPFFRDPNLKDVTEYLHENANEVSVEVIKGSKDHKVIYLCDYTSSNKWSAIDWTEIKNDRCTFSSVGSGKIYMPAEYKNNEYNYIHPPIYLEENGHKIILNANLEEKEKIRLYRKHPRGIGETRFAKKMIETYFQVANKSDFSDAVTIFKIKDIPDKAEEVKVNLNKKYQFIRHVADTTINIAELGFFDKNETRLNGKVICSSKDTKFRPEYAFDGNIRTNYNNDNTKSWIGLALDRPIEISKVKYLFRNSFNTIEPNNQYELFYWQDSGGWISLGKKNAQLDYIDFIAPKNALLLLRNHTQGNAEMIFFMKAGEQIWG
ncbi:discoidin domain-containing protein [Aestuariibaculum sediminum]|uniref:Discoidin domain-containing protein n=1 Tax=Aestuariibaculum sediminum TaxID=2770637 RepID=A0A8J6U903_9FLAO|nr:discoidin domain-containing protein [Aestuariibaculum sediminum]MBD0833713.1 discoidin domain-containing protein [Aestuariibaculum sediminum]